MGGNPPDTLRDWFFSRNLGVSLNCGRGPFGWFLCDAHARIRENHAAILYFRVSGVFGGVRFAHSHARGPVLGSCGGAPGYSKINQNGIIINTGRAPEPFSSCFSNFEIFDFFHSTLPYRHKTLQNGL